MKYEEFKDELEKITGPYSVKYECGFDSMNNIIIVLAGFYSHTTKNIVFKENDPFAIIRNNYKGSFTINPEKTTDDPWGFDAEIIELIRQFAYTPIDERDVDSFVDPFYLDLFNHDISLANDKRETNKPGTITKDFIDEMKKKNVDSEISKDRRTITLKRKGKTIAHVSTVIRYKVSIMVDLPKDLAKPILKYTSTSAKDRGETPADPNDVNITLHGEKAKAFRNVLRNLQSVNVNHLEPESVVLNIRDVDIYNTDVFSRILLRISEKINQSSERE